MGERATPRWGTSEAKESLVVGCYVNPGHIAYRETFDKIGGCPYCLRTPEQRIAYVEEQGRKKKEEV